MKKLATFLLACSAISTARADSYIPQASFTVMGSTVVGMDQDAAGNLYVLAHVPGTATSYTVSSYLPPSLTPELSFGVTITTPLAFAVQANGVIDILDAGNALTLTQWDNAGNLINQVSRISPYMTSYFTGAIDKTNSLLYLSYPSAVIQGTGDFSFKILYYQGAISQYNFSGQLQRTFDLPGRTTISTTCYTPSLMTVDSQSNLWVGDPVCYQVLSFNSTGAQTQDFPLPSSPYPRGIWTGPGGNVFVDGTICDVNGCPHGEIYEFDSGGALQTSFMTNTQISAQVGEAWDPRILYLAAPGGPTIERYILDAPPTAPVPSLPAGFTLQHSSMATVSWQASTDPDGDPILYSVYIGTSASHMNFAGNTTQTVFVSTPLAFGTTYYWQATAQDSYLGLPMLTSTGAIVSFEPSFLDNPPGAFTVASGTGTSVTRSTSVTFGWTPAVDLYGDPLTYNVSWRPVSQSSATMVATAANSLSVTGLAFGATVYWSVTACDPYGVCTPMSGGTQSYLPVFQNVPPPAPPITAGTGLMSEHMLSPSAVLSWSPVTDIEGDPTSYHISIGTSANSLVPTQLGAATGDDIAGLSFDTTYYWTVSASNPYGAASTSTLQSFFIVLQDTPPGSFGVVSGAGTPVTRATTQLLAWSSSTDTDGDTVTYGLSLSTSPGSLAMVQLSTATSYLLSFQFGATYYWSVSAFDGYGGTTTITGGTEVFLPIFQNLPPSTATITSGTGILAEHTLSPSAILSWSPVSDPEGDPISYQVEFGTAPSALNAVQSGTATSVDVLGLGFNTTYYWTVSGSNPYGAASTTPVQSLLLVLQDTPPGPFSVLSGTGTLTTRTTSELLAWSAVSDVDGDTVTYVLSLSTAQGGLSKVQCSSVTTSYVLNFQYGTTYYWSVAAFDGFGGTTTITGGTQSFLATFLDQVPMPVQLAPQPVISTMRGNVTVTWQAVTNPEGDPTSYTVLFGDSAGNLQPFAQIAPTTTGGAAAQSLRVMQTTPQAQSLVSGSTITLTLSGLDYYQPYFLQVRAADPYGGTSLSPVQTFTLSSESGFPPVYNYPNPFSPLRGGTNIVFNAPPSGYAQATVEVYSEWQKLLFKQDYFNIPPGVSQVQFSGQDRYGRPLFNGSYICRVRFSGPDGQTIFYLLVVK